MSETGGRGAFRFRPEIGAVLFLLFLSIVLGLEIAWGPIAGFLLATLGIGSGLLLHRGLGERARTAAAVPMLLTSGILAIESPVTLSSEVLAGGIGLALLLWLASEPYPRGRWVEASGALVVPMLAVLVGVLASLLLPTGPDFLGVAAALLVAELLFAGWLYAHPAELAGSAEGPARA